MMLDMDVNPVPATQIVAASQVVNANAVPVAAALSKELKACQDVESAISGPGVNNLAVVQQFSGALGYKFNKKIRYYDQSPTEFRRIADLVKVVSPPQHGSVVKKDGDFPSWQNVPEAGYVGKDRVSFFIEANGKRVLMTYNLWVTPVINERQDNHQDCDFVQFGQVPADWSLDSLNALVNLSGLLSAASLVGLSFGDLPATALGQTTGEGAQAAITLDTTAAGHGWYVDPTPLDNTDDYLPTSNPNIWQAKAGTDAAGKMDMLSVLLHEYGHALGLQHSAQVGDFMNATLQPGERRLPNADELALMSQLVAELKTASDSQSPHPSPLPGGEGGIPGNPLSLLGLLPLGFVRRNSAGNGAATGTVHTDYLTAIQPTLTNGSFATGLAQWESTGAVSTAGADAAHYTVTLSESSTTSAGQTHVGQAFVLGATDRFLSFTVNGMNLQSNSNAVDTTYTTAQDAFEVALLNANTGASLLGGLFGSGNATHSDAALNIQLASSKLQARLLTLI